MLFGGTGVERVALNHENLWRGVTRNRTTEPKHQHLAEIREKLLAGQWMEGAELATKYLSGHDRRVQPYQPVGDLTLHSPGHEVADNYGRTLDLAGGIVEVSYRVGGTSYRREAFASAEDGVIVIRIAADKAGAVTTVLRLDRIADPDCTLKAWAGEARFGFEGRFEEGITFAVEARVQTAGGQVTPGDGATVEVKGASEVLIVLTIAVDYNQPDPAAWVAKHLNKVPMDFDLLRRRHVAEHSALFGRVSLDVGHNAEAESLPLEQRLARLRQDGDDPGLIALYFQFGRYLLMASSRRCDQPAHLQGIWNEELRPPWDSDFHHDMNIQMNYWPAEVCNLAECAEPLFKYLWRAIPQGSKAAKDLYNCRGILLPIQTDVWDRATPESPGWDVWTGAAAWLAEHLWWRYEYTLDKDFLRERAYPFLKLVGEFYEDYLVRDARGRLVTVPSQSPENRFVGGASPVSLCVAATMDLLLIREVLSRCLRASEILETDAELRPKWEAILRDLPQFQIGRYGQLQEWLEDFEESEPGHRHYSHLLGVHPGEQMTPDVLPEFWRAARVSLERRLAAGGGHTGWSRAWTVAFWARFFEGGAAHEHLVHLLTDFCTNSLLDLHPPEIFQIDGNLGGTAAIAEMLIQSHGGAIRLLPSLPPQWPNGEVRGLRARGGFVVDITWRDGEVVEARVKSECGQPCRICCPADGFVATCDGQAIPTAHDARGHLEFATEPGQTITLTGLRVKGQESRVKGAKGPESESLRL
jgi:alpha-L-fucosidase 2